MNNFRRLLRGRLALHPCRRQANVLAGTFILEYDTIANNDHIMIRMRFEGGRVTVEGKETAHEVGVSFEGKIKE